MMNDTTSTSAALTSQTERTGEPDQRCQHCGMPPNPSKPSIKETALSIISACLLLTILVPLGLQANKWADHVFERSLHHLLWREPLEDWSR